MCYQSNLGQSVPVLRVSQQRWNSAISTDGASAARSSPCRGPRLFLRWRLVDSFGREPWQQLTPRIHAMAPRRTIAAGSITGISRAKSTVVIVGGGDGMEVSGCGAGGACSGTHGDGRGGNGGGRDGGGGGGCREVSGCGACSGRHGDGRGGNGGGRGGMGVKGGGGTKHAAGATLTSSEIGSGRPCSSRYGCITPPCAAANARW